MDFNRIEEIMRASREASFSRSGQLSLGELIEQLEKIERSDAIVKYDFGYMFPTSIDSWRGSYEELALDYTESGDELTVLQLLDILRSTIGKEFTGYKGGEFTMFETTPVWVANCGNSGQTGVVGVIDDGYQAIILTSYCEF